MANETKLLPLARVLGREFLVDIDSREFIDDSGRRISMHSEQGRRLVDEMVGIEWRCFSVYPGNQIKA